VTRSLLVVFCLCAFAHSQSPSPDQVYTIDPKIIHPPVPIRTPESEMPDLARLQQHGGLCVLEIIVDKHGFPQTPRVIHCTDPAFAANSLNAVRKYTFHPATTIQDNSPVAARMHIEIKYSFGGDTRPIPLPRPRIRVGFLVPQEPASEPDSNGIYSLSAAFHPPDSPPKLLGFANAGFGRAAFSQDDGAGCLVVLTIDSNGVPSDPQITKCDARSLEEPAIHSLLKSQFSPAILNGKAVPVRATVHLVCEGFEPPPVQ
jgi:hypothetical protein